MELLQELIKWIEEQHSALADEQVQAQEALLKREGMLLAVDLVHQKIGNLINGQATENTEPGGPETEETVEEGSED